MSNANDPPGSGRVAERRRRIGQVIATALAGVLAAVGVISMANTVRMPSQMTGQTSIETPTPVASAMASDTPPASIAPSGAGITQDEAIAVARRAAPEAAGWDVRVAEAGPLEEVFTARGEFDWSRELPPDRWIWQVTLGIGGALDSEGAHVFIDFADGTVYHVLKTRG